MQNKITENEFINLIILAALILSFSQKEKVLSLEEITARNFAPSTSLTRSLIYRLLKSADISAFLLPRFCIDHSQSSQKRVILINSPARKEDLLVDLMFKVKSYVANTELGLIPKNSFFIDILAGECIEYAEFYAIRNNLHLEKPSHHNTHLKLLLINNSRDQVFMLLWRSIKSIKKTASKSNSVLFAELAEKAYDFYNWYKSKGIKIEEYSWPMLLKCSKISSLLTYDILEKQKDNYYL